MAEAWELPAFEGALGGPVAKWRERKARTAEWITSLRETAAIADGLEVTGTLAAEPIVARAAVDALLAHLQGGRGLGIGPFKAKVVKDTRVALGSVRVDGQEPVSVPVLLRLRAWVDARVVVGRARTTWSHERRLSGLVIQRACQRRSSCCPRRVLAACMAEAEVFCGRPNAGLRCRRVDEAAWSALRRAAWRSTGRGLQAAQAELACRKARVEICRKRTPRTRARSARRDRPGDPKAFAAARAAVENVGRCGPPAEADD